jgi:hypothetical protein
MRSGCFALPHDPSPTETWVEAHSGDFFLEADCRMSSPIRCYVGGLPDLSKWHCRAFSRRWNPGAIGVTSQPIIWFDSYFSTAEVGPSYISFDGWDPAIRYVDDGSMVPPFSVALPYP